MLADAPKGSYSRQEALRVAGVSERQLRQWEKQDLVPALDEYAFSDLIAIRSLLRLKQNRVPPARIRGAVKALRSKLAGVENPLKELKIISEGRRIAVLISGQKMEAVSGQLLLDFDRSELKSLLAFHRPDPGARQREAEAWFEKGLELEQTGAPLEEIIQTYRRALELDPRSAGALVNLGTIYFHLKTWKEAERCYLDAVEIDPGYALAHFNLGNLYDEQGNDAAAAAQYTAALKVQPSYADAHYNLALLSQKQGDALKAVRHWKAYLKLDGASSWAHIARRELQKLCRATIVPGSRGSAAPGGAASVS